MTEGTLLMLFNQNTNSLIDCPLLQVIRALKESERCPARFEMSTGASLSGSILLPLRDRQSQHGSAQTDSWHLIGWQFAQNYWPTVTKLIKKKKRKKKSSCWRLIVTTSDRRKERSRDWKRKKDYKIERKKERQSSFFYVLSILKGLFPAKPYSLAIISCQVDPWHDSASVYPLSHYGNQGQYP